MAIVKLDKLTLYGPLSQKEEFLDRLQEFGCIHLSDLETDSSQVNEFQPVLTKAHKALDYLNSCPLQRKQSNRPQEFDMEQVVAQALELQNQQRELADEEATLKREIHELLPWGNFTGLEDNNIGGIYFWFYVIPRRDVDKLVELDYTYQEVAADHMFSYVVVLNETEPDEFPGTLVQLPDKPLAELQKRLEEIEQELEHLHFQHADLTRWISLMQVEIDGAADTECAAVFCSV